MLTTEAVYTFAELVRQLPSFHGRRIHVSTLHRWCQRGVRGVRLECRRLGGRIVTSVEAVDRFSARLAEMGTAAVEPADIAKTTGESESMEPVVRSASHVTRTHLGVPRGRRGRRRRTDGARQAAIEREERYLRERGM